MALDYKHTLKISDWIKMLGPYKKSEDLRIILNKLIDDLIDKFEINKLESILTYYYSNLIFFFYYNFKYIII